VKKLPRIILVLIAGLLGAARGLAASDASGVGAPAIAGLTTEERAWIAAHPVVRVGHDPSYAPYSFPDAGGQLVGIDLDFIAHIARRTGLRFQNEVRQDWSQVMADFKAGRIDMLMSLGYMPEREQFLIYSQPYGYAPDVIVTRDDTPQVFSLGDLKGRKVALVRDYDYLHKEMQDSAPGVIMVDYANTEECLLAVAQGEADGAVADVVNAAYFVKTRRLSNLRLGSVIGSTHTNEMRIGVRKDLAVLAGIIDKALADISPAERQEISNRWVAVDVSGAGWWFRAVKIASVVAAVVLAGLLALFLHNRRLARELAERRRIQIELEQTRDRLARLSEEKSALLNMVTHDLRNPLTGLTLGLDLLQLNDLNKEAARQTLQQLRAATRQMMRLTDNLVDANLLEAGRRNFEWAPVDAAALFREAVDVMRETAARKQIRLELTTAEPVMPLQSDQTALRQVADNLISNAVKFSPPGLAVEVDLRWVVAGLRVQVRDHGPGVSPDAHDRIFTQYGQGEARPTGGEKSTGLGLWIVQRVVRGLQGRVWCENAPGAGAVFLVELPLHPAAATA
jgi:polar amino acid transport system substrate-binding protein